MRHVILFGLALFSFSVRAVPPTPLPEGELGNPEHAPAQETTPVASAEPTPDAAEVGRRENLDRLVGGKAAEFDPKIPREFNARLGLLRGAVTDLTMELDSLSRDPNPDSARYEAVLDQLLRGRELLKSATETRVTLAKQRDARFEDAASRATSTVSTLLGTLLDGTARERDLRAESARTGGLPERLEYSPPDGKNARAIDYVGRTQKGDVALYADAGGRVFGVPTQGDLGPGKARALELTGVTAAEAQRGAVVSVDMSRLMNGTPSAIFPEYFAKRQDAEVVQPAKAAFVAAGGAVTDFSAAVRGRVGDFVSSLAAATAAPELEISRESSPAVPVLRRVVWPAFSVGSGAAAREEDRPGIIPSRFHFGP